MENNGVTNPNKIVICNKHFLYKGSNIRIVESVLAIVVYTG